MVSKDVERIRALEVRTETIMAQLTEVNNKLDSLLELKHKGIGAFWVASALLGTGIVGSLQVVWAWLRTH